MSNSRWLRTTSRNFGTLLAITTFSTYVLIATGALITTTNAGAACSTWPICVGGPDSIPSPAFLLLIGHRLLSVVVGVLLALTFVFSRRTETNRRTRVAIAAGTAAFPIQIGVGALVVVTSVPYAGRLHLAIAAVIFVTLLLALGWTLEGYGPESRSPLAEPTPDERTTGESASKPAGDAEEPVHHSARDRCFTDRVRTTVLAYLELTKPRLMWLLCLLALAGIALATTTGQWPSGVTVVATLAGGVLAIGASGTFNHLFERERDQRMERTADRPVATDQIPIVRAALFGCGLLVLSTAVMVTFVNALAAVLTLAAVVYYSVLYTVILKPNTSWNIAIGGGAGALPAVIGWTAVTGSIGIPAVILAALVVVWTPAHFYNLAIVYRDDYARADYPMFPVVSGVSAARRRIVLMLGVTLLTTTVLGMVTPLGWIFAVSTILVGAVFLASIVSQCRVRTDAATLRSFYVSNAYLGVVLLAIIAEAVLQFV